MEDDAVEVKSFNEATVTGIYSFTFSENPTAGCSETAWTEDHCASIAFVFHRATGSLELSAGTSKRIDELPGLLVNRSEPSE